MTGFERVRIVTDYIQGYRLPMTLRDGTMMTLRPICPDDEARLAAFHRTLSEQSVYMRYFTPVELSRRIDHKRLERICHADQERDVVLVAEWIYPYAEDLPMIVGVGRLTLCPPPDVGEAEFAVIVSDEWQGRGVGRQLLERLIEIGREKGLRRIIAYILPENARMLNLCEKLGFHITFDSSEALLRATLPL